MGNKMVKTITEDLMVKISYQEPLKDLNNLLVIFYKDGTEFNRLSGQKAYNYLYLIDHPLIDYFSPDFKRFDSLSRDFDEFAQSVNKVIKQFERLVQNKDLIQGKNDDL